MIRICEIKTDALEKTDALPAKVEKRLHLPAGSVESVCIAKESTDARQKPNIYKVYSLDLITKIKDEEILERAKALNLKCEKIADEKIDIPKKDFSYRPVVVGSGPCGLFAALVLAKAGLRPYVIERGADVETRIKAVEDFWNGGKLNFKANAQFGEGGAGTFSDGKLNTGTKSIYQRFVLEEFVKAGADKEILYKQKPHIGTDVLRKVIVNIRKEIETLGGEYLFETEFLDFETDRYGVSSVICDKCRIDTKALILACGHSARDTVRGLYNKGVEMQQKQFSMGVRIEHSQELIDNAQYGKVDPKLRKVLGPADYKLNAKLHNGRGIYTFCMCPGGNVVNASSHEGMVVCNGMSNFHRDSGKANSAVLVDVRTDDFESESPIAGIAFQEKYERLAFECGGSNYSLPKENIASFNSSSSTIKKCLPSFVYGGIVEGLPLLARKLKGFDSPESVLYGIESRSSSPVRITRSENGLGYMNHEETEGFYPAGEGAGYAGGIMSAACDGIRAAMRLMSKEG